MKKKQVSFKKIVVFIILLLPFIALIWFLNKLEFVDNTQKVLSILQSLFSLVTASGISIVLFQLFEQQKQGKVNLEVIKKEKSLQKMKDFADYLEDISFIVALYKKDKRYNALLSQLDKYDNLTFRLDELKSIFKEKEDQDVLLRQIGKLIENDFEHIASIYLDYYSVDKKEQESIKRFSFYNWDAAKIKKAITDDLVKDEESSKVKQLISSEIRELAFIKHKIAKTIDSKITLIINSLEHFSSSFNCGLADEEMVYQSLHQAYIKVVTYFYPFICSSNSSSIADHYYSNIISLFKIWMDRYKKTVSNETINRDQLLIGTKTKKTL